MSTAPLRILLIEDNPADADLIQDELTLENEPSHHIEHASRLKDGLERLAVDTFDLVLLDLSLPDCRGLETFLRAYRRHPDVPFIIISGLDDLSVAFDAVRSGAQDYLFKGELDRPMLLRAVGFAVERHARLRHWNPFLTGRSPSTPAAEPVKRPTIASVDRELHGQLIERYRHLVELSSRQRLYREVQNVSGELHGLAMYLCMLQAGAEDAETIHVAALEQLVGQVAPDQASAYVEEAQMLRTELYRYLTDCYRDAALGHPPMPAPGGSSADPQKPSAS